MSSIPSPLPSLPCLPPYSFVSVRDASSSPSVYSFQRALHSGYAPDGGMLMPSPIPHLSLASFDDLRCLSYQALLVRVLRFFISEEELSTSALTEAIHRSFQRFDCPDPSPTVALRELSYKELKGKPWEGLTLLNLYHGPTLTFKDVALQPLASLLSHFATTESSPLHILVGTSGDTGSAAIEAVASLPNTHLYVLYPLGRISRLQELQMTTQCHPNVHVIGVDGTSDDLDLPIQRIFEDLDLRQRHRLCSINSINITRILCQTAHLFHAALLLTSTSFPSSFPSPSPSTVSLCIPSGALGHLTSALLCLRMGAPIRRIVVATNSNRCVEQLINEGVYRPSKEVHVTSSCAMDISSAYNVERFIYLLQPQGDAQCRAERVRACVQRLEESGEFHLMESERSELRRLCVSAMSVSEEEVELTIRSVFRDCGELLDPHTAVGVCAAAAVLHDREEGERVICIATAHPAKFVEAVARATGKSREELRDRWLHSSSSNVANTQTLEGRKTFSVEWSKDKDWTSELKQLIEAQHRFTSQ